MNTNGDLDKNFLLRSQIFDCHPTTELEFQLHAETIRSRTRFVIRRTDRSPSTNAKESETPLLLAPSPLLEDAEAAFTRCSNEPHRTLERVPLASLRAVCRRAV